MAAPSTLFCTAFDLATYLSDTGVMSRVDDNENGDFVGDPVEEAAFRMALSYGTLEVAKYIQRRYSPFALAQSDLVRYFATVFGCKFLCQRRGNPVPESLMEEVDLIIGQLEDIRNGLMDVPDIAERVARGPVVVNNRADARFARPLRRQINQSTPRGPKSNTGIDYADQFDFPR